MKPIRLAIIIWLATWHCQSSASAPLDLTLAEARNSLYTHQYRGERIRITGVVTAITDGMIYLRDGTAPFGITFTNAIHGVSPGDKVTITYDKTKSVHPKVDQLTVVGHQPPPPPVPVLGCDLTDRSRLFEFVEARGVVFTTITDESDANYRWTIINTQQGQLSFPSTENTFPITRLKGLADAEISVRGVVRPHYTWRRNLGCNILPLGTNSITIVTPAPTSIDSCPAFQIATAEIASTDRAYHRQRLSGTVMALAHDCFYLKYRDKIIRVKSADGNPDLKAGQRVTVAGFVEHDPLNIQLVEAITRTNSAARAVQPPALRARIEEFQSLEDARLRANIRFDRKIITTVARVMDADGPTPFSFVLGNQQQRVFVDASSLRETIKLPLPGSVVEVTGLCIAEFENLTSKVIFPRFRTFTLIPRTAADIVVVRRPPWWTVGRLLALVVLLVAAIVAILFWNRALKVLSERRGRELYKEELAHALAEWKVEERTRLSVELHDSISQTLTGVALQVDAAKESGVDGKSPAAKFLETARAMLASCRQELRCCIWDLRSRTFEEKDMTEAVRRTLAPHAGDVDILVRFNVPRETLSETSAHDILRIIRELTVNAIRHGHAAHIRIAGELHDGIIRFSVKDDGCGFDPESIPGPRQGHFGLQGIRERIGGHDGELTIESSNGHGTRVTVSFAADDRENIDEQS